MKLHVIYDHGSHSTSDRYALDPDGQWWTFDKQRRKWRRTRGTIKTRPGLSRPGRDIDFDHDGPWVVGL